METKSTMGGAQIGAQQTQMSDRLIKLHQQNSTGESINNDAYGILDRLRTLGNKVNSIGHPDNQESEKISNSSDRETIPKQSADGLVGEIDSVLNKREDLIYEWNERIFPALLRNLNYLEQAL